MIVSANNYALEFERINNPKPRHNYNNGFWVKCFKCGRITHDWDNIRKHLSVLDIRLIFKGQEKYICPRCQDNINKVFLSVSQVKLNMESVNYGSI